MTDRLIPHWSDELRDAFLKAPIAFQHRVGASGLVEDDALIALLDRYPAELIDINHYTYDAQSQVTLRTGRRGTAGGAEVLESIKAGRLWVNMRQADTVYPELGREVHRAFAELRELIPGFKPAKVYGQLILSSPKNRTPYHADPAGVVLFHMRGRKRLWIYPADEAHAPQEHMEAVTMRLKTEELPYREEMDAAATVYDLEPGMAACWPIHAPHRVDNLGEFNVSFSADYQTWPSRLTCGAHIASGVFRRRGLPAPNLRRTPMAAQACLWAASVAMKKAGLVEDRISKFERSFELGRDDPDAGKMTAN